MKKIIYTLLVVVSFMACQEPKSAFPISDQDLLDSLRNDSNAISLEIASKNLILYLDKDFDWKDEDFEGKYYAGNLIIRNTKEEKEDTVMFTGNDYPSYILKGKTDSTVGIITIGGSGGYCMLTIVDLDKKKEICCNDIDTNFFCFEGYTNRGYKCTCFIRTYDGYGINYDAEIDFTGKTIYMKEMK